MPSLTAPCSGTRTRGEVCMLLWSALCYIINPIYSKGNCSATSNNTKLAHWPLMGGVTGVGCYIWYSEEGPGRAAALPSPLIAVPNVTAYPSTANVSITVLLYDGLLLCGFNVAIKGLSSRHKALRNSAVRLFVCLFVCLSSVCRLQRILLQVGSLSRRTALSCYIMLKTLV